MKTPIHLVLAAAALAPGMLAGQARCDWSAATQGPAACLEVELAGHRAALDAAMLEYGTLLGRDEARSLERAQDEWERWVERDCETSAARFGALGTEAVALLACLVEETSRRRFQMSLMLGARTRVDFDRSAPCLVPDSDLAVLGGWVGERLYQGAPGPVAPEGEGPQHVLVLNLDQPLCLDYGDGPEQVTAVQMVASGVSFSRGMARYIGQRVEIHGRLFLAEAGRDRTPILIMVPEVVPFG